MCWQTLAWCVQHHRPGGMRLEDLVVRWYIYMRVVEVAAPWRHAVRGRISGYTGYSSSSFWV